MAERVSHSVSHAPDSYFFDGGSFEPRSGRLVHLDDEVRLRPKTAGVLAALLERPGQLISKSVLVDRVWGGTAGDEALAVCVAELRRALHEDSSAARLIGTVHRRGYRFIGAVSTVPLEVPARPGRGLVGRGPALDVLEGWWSRASMGDRTTGFVAGEAGSGKTALIRAFVGQVRAREVVAIGEGRCADRHGAEPYLPFLDVLTSLAHGPNGSVFRELLWELAPSWLLHLTGLVPPDAVELLQRRAADRSSGRLRREASEVLDAFTLVVPTIVVLEDLHSADRATTELLAHLTERPTRSRLLLLASYRPDELASARPLAEVLRSLRGRRRCEHHDLAPLGEDAVADLLRRRLDPAEPSGVLARQVHARTEGNALFVTTLVERLIDDDALVDRDGVLVARAPLAELGVPRNIRDLIVERVAKFDECQLHLLLAGAAAGVEFSSGEVAAGAGSLAGPGTAPADVGEVESRLLDLAAGSGVLDEVDPATPLDGSVSARFRFHHELVRDALHEQLVGVRSVLVHRAIGGMLEQAPRGAEREPAVVAEHFELGRDDARAALHFARAADVARYRLAHDEALALARRAASLAARPGAALDREVQLGLHVSLVAATLAVHGVAGQEVEAAVREAEAITDAMPHSATAGRARYLFWSIAFMAGDIRTAAARLVALEGSAAGAGDELLALQVENARTVTSFAAGAPAAALDHAARFRALEADRSGSADADRARHEITMLNRSSTSLASWLVGRPDDALRVAHDGLRIARAQGSPALVCQSLWPVAAVHQLRGESRMVGRYAQELSLLAESDATSRWRLVGDVFAGWAASSDERTRRVRTGDAAVSRAERVRHCLDALVEDGMGFGRPYHLALAVEASLDAGEARQALDAADDGIAASESTGDRWYLAELFRLRAEALLASSATDPPSRRASLQREAAGMFAEAAELARAQGASALEERVGAGEVRRSSGHSAREKAEARSTWSRVSATPV